MILDGFNKRSAGRKVERTGFWVRVIAYMMEMKLIPAL
jgi:hypothetical protein